MTIWDATYPVVLDALPIEISWRTAILGWRLGMVMITVPFLLSWLSCTIITTSFLFVLVLLVWRLLLTSYQHHHDHHSLLWSSLWWLSYGFNYWEKKTKKPGVNYSNSLIWNNYHHCSEVAVRSLSFYSARNGRFTYEKWRPKPPSFLSPTGASMGDSMLSPEVGRKGLMMMMEEHNDPSWWSKRFSSMIQWSNKKHVQTCPNLVFWLKQWWWRDF